MDQAILSILLKLLSDHCLEQQEACMKYFHEAGNCQKGDSVCSNKLLLGYQFCEEQYLGCMKAGNKARKIK